MTKSIKVIFTVDLVEAKKCRYYAHEMGKEGVSCYYCSKSLKNLKDTIKWAGWKHAVIRDHLAACGKWVIGVAYSPKRS